MHVEKIQIAGRVLVGSPDGRPKLQGINNHKHIGRKRNCCSFVWITEIKRFDLLQTLEDSRSAHRRLTVRLTDFRKTSRLLSKRSQPNFLFSRFSCTWPWYQLDGVPRTLTYWAWRRRSRSRGQIWYNLGVTLAHFAFGWWGQNRLY